MQHRRVPRRESRIGLWLELSPGGEMTLLGCNDMVYVGPYEVLKPIGHGGMGQVSLARAPSGLQIVLKRPLNTRENRRADRNRQLIHEASIAKLLLHPNIVAVYDVDLDQNGECYLAMEYLEGWDLASISRELKAQDRYLPLPIVMALTIEACRGLFAAHTCCHPSGDPLNLVHRDISPSNLFLTTTGVLKILDFGIAKSSFQLRRTETGVVKGKVDYMSPEQLRGDPLDCRTDIFSLGVVLYLLLTNTSPFHSVSFLERANGAMYAPPPPRRPALPDTGQVSTDLAMFSLRLLASHRELRYADALEVEKALQVLRGDEEPPLPEDIATYVTSLFEARGTRSTRPGSRRGSQIIVSGWSDGMTVPLQEAEDARQEVPDTEENPRRSPATSEQDDASNRLPAAQVVEAGARDQRARPQDRSSFGRSRFIWLSVALVCIGVGFAAGMMVRSDGGSRRASPETPPPHIRPNDSVDPPEHALAKPTPVPAPERTLVSATEDTAVTGGNTTGAPLAGPQEKHPTRNINRTESRSGEAKRKAVGQLSLQVVPWADVYFEGKLLGGSPLVEQTLPAGRVRLEIVNSERGLRREISVEINAGKLVRQTVYLDAP